jgi:uncharacterized protein (DUF433 family)/DNA-binding transcriptional MerR regulator
MTHIDLLDTPMYSPTMASRLVGLRPERVRRWLRGYEFPVGKGNHRLTKRQKPVVHRKKTAGQAYASFLDLVDLLFVKRFLEEGFSLQKLRAALNEAEEVFEGRRFAHRDFWTDGSRIYLRIKDHPGDLLELLSGGQWAIRDIILRFATQIDFAKGSGLAERWYPMGKNHPVVLDPQIAFGAPTVVDRGTQTDNIYDFFVAEREDIARTRDWFDLTAKEVRSAVEFERHLVAA